MTTINDVAVGDRYRFYYHNNNHRLELQGKIVEIDKRRGVIILCVKQQYKAFYGENSKSTSVVERNYTIKSETLLEKL